jgi:hypothetical protein
MLFLYRPPQTWMPYALPRSRTQQVDYNRELQRRFASTRRVAPAAPQRAERDPAADERELDALHECGALTEAELAAAKSRLLPVP